MRPRKTRNTRKAFFARWAAGLLLLLVASRMAIAGDAPVADAAEKDDARAIRELVSAKANVNAPQADGMTALHWAVRD